MRSLSFMTAVCIVVLAAPLRAQSDTCLSHLQESGSVFIGKVLESYQEFSGIDKATALRRLEAQLPDAGVTIASVNAEAGTIKGLRQDPLLSYPFPISFTVSSTASGVRIRFWLRTLPGQMPIGRFKHGICDTLKLAAAEPPSETQDETETSGQEAKPSGTATDAPTATKPDEDESEKPLSAEAIAKLTGEPSDDQPSDKEAGSAPKKKPQKALTNEDILAMVKADLGDKIVVDKIRSSPGDKLDTSSNELIRLRKAGVSMTVIEAMIKRADE